MAQHEDKTINDFLFPLLVGVIRRFLSGWLFICPSHLSVTQAFDAVLAPAIASSFAAEQDVHNMLAVFPSHSICTYGAIIDLCF
jgi:hypothetical protein